MHSPQRRPERKHADGESCLPPGEGAAALSVANRSGQEAGEIGRTRIRAWNSALLGEIDRKNIRDAHGVKVAEFDGKVLKEDLGKKLATLTDMQAVIEGGDGIELAALWYFFAR